MMDGVNIPANTDVPDGHDEGREENSSEDAEVEEEVLIFSEETAPKTEHEDDGQSKVPLWLITFTDVMALMLTFFVLLYSMSTPKEEKWEDISSALSHKLNHFDAAAFNAGSQDVISLDKISKTKALELGYVKALVESLLKKRKVEDVLLIQNGKRLVISLPSELLFSSGRADVSAEGKKIIFELGGVLSRVKNRIEVVGNTDPRPITARDGQYTTNWELSLARATSVSSVLRDVGYVRDMTVRGLSSARFDELPETLSQDERFALSRRVDIVVMDDDGYRLNAFDTP